MIVTINYMFIVSYYVEFNILFINHSHTVVYMIITIVYFYRHVVLAEGLVTDTQSNVMFLKC